MDLSDFPWRHGRGYGFPRPLTGTTRTPGTSQVPRFLCRCMPPSSTPGAPTGAACSWSRRHRTRAIFGRWVGRRLALRGRTRRSRELRPTPSPSGVSPPSRRSVRTDTGHASPPRVTPRRLAAATCRASDLHGRLLSFCKRNQASPDAPKTPRSPRTILLKKPVHRASNAALHHGHAEVQQVPKLDPDAALAMAPHRCNPNVPSYRIPIPISALFAPLRENSPVFHDATACCSSARSGSRRW